MNILCLKTFSTVGLMLTTLLLGGCLAGQPHFQQGQQAMLEQNYGQAVINYLDAVTADPQNRDYLLKLNQAREKAALWHLRRAETFLAAGEYRAARQEYQLAVEYDSSLMAAAEGALQAEKQFRAESLLADAVRLSENDQHSQAIAQLNDVLELIPDHATALKLKEDLQREHMTLIDGAELDVMSQKPITLNFNQTRLPDVFDILTKLSGIHFILDDDIRDGRTTLFLEQASFAQALELLLRMNNLDKKILNRKTIILYPNTRDKQKQYQDHIVQIFYLSHINAKEAVNMLRAMLQIRKVYVQEDVNAIVIRDQPDVVRLARKMIEATDRSSSEVVFELELIEVNHSDTQELGLKLSNYSIGGGLSLPGSGVILDSGVSAGGSTLNLTDLSGSLDPFYSLPTAAFRFLKTRLNAEILANPRIRVRNNRQAKVHVGSREPVITVTINNQQTSENVQYIDVGVKLEVEPNIKLDNTIETKLKLEVSNVSGRERTNSGTAVITISSTNAETTLNLKDGQQTVIGGLIRNDNAVTKNKIPLLGDIPLLGELFNGTDRTKTKREILLSITPHIVKTVRVPTGDAASIWSGGEDDLKFGKNFGTFAEEYRTGQQDSLIEPQRRHESITTDLLEQLKTPLPERETGPENGILMEFDVKDDLLEPVY